MVKTNRLGKFGHILCILGAFWAINSHSRGSTSHHLSDLIFMFLESVDLGGWGQLDSQFKNDIFVFLPPPLISMRVSLAPFQIPNYQSPSILGLTAKVLNLTAWSLQDNNMTKRRKCGSEQAMLQSVKADCVRVLLECC